jgi:Secretion system C-terminal sorting domain
VQKFFFIVCLITISLAGVYAQTPAIEWQRTIGGDSQDAIFSAAQTTDGGYILGGYSSSGISGEKTDTSRGYEDYWVVKLNSTGIIEWDKTYGGDSTDYLQVVLQTAEGGYMLGGYTYSSNTGDKSDPAKGSWDTWLIKIDPAGNIEWDKSYGGDEKDGLVSMKQTSDGGYLFWAVSKTNANGDKTEISRGLSDYWIVKIDSLGTIEWEKTIGSTNMDHILSLDETSDGGYLLAGFSMSGTGGEKTQASFGFWDFWIVKLDALLNVEWDKSFGGTSSEHIMSAKQLSNGNYLIGGFSSSGASGNKVEPTRGIYDYWILEIDALGNKNWEKAYGGSSAEEMRAGISITSSGDYILGGFSQSDIGGEKTDSTRGADDYWLIKTDLNGDIIWDKTIGGSGTEFLYSVTPTTDNGYLVAGWSDSPISGEKTDSSRGSFDFWIVKLAPDFSALNVENFQESTPVKVNIYPNPFSTSAVLLIDIENTTSKSYSLSLYDLNGKIVRTIDGISGNKIELQRGNLISGTYIYKLTSSGSELSTGKFIIQ